MCTQILKVVVNRFLQIHWSIMQHYTLLFGVIWIKWYQKSDWTCDGWQRRSVRTLPPSVYACHIPSLLAACAVLSKPARWHFQAAELWDLPMSPFVVISDCYSPDNDALVLVGENDIQPTSRSAWHKVVFPLIHQTGFCLHRTPLTALMKTKWVLAVRECSRIERASISFW